MKQKNGTPKLNKKGIVNKTYLNVKLTATQF